MACPTCHREVVVLAPVECLRCSSFPGDLLDPPVSRLREKKSEALSPGDVPAVLVPNAATARSSLAHSRRAVATSTGRA